MHPVIIYYARKRMRKYLVSLPPPILASIQNSNHILVVKELNVEYKLDMN